MVLAERLATLERLRADLGAQNALVCPMRDTVASGFPAFDRLLGGFPRPGIVEVVGATGRGRLLPFLPLLTRLTRSGQPVAVVDVLERLYPPGLHGVELAHLLVVRPGPERAIWATEQILSSGAVPLVLLLDPVTIGAAGHRLLHASERGHSLLAVLTERSEPRLPAALRLEARFTPGGRPRVGILHQRGASKGQEVELTAEPRYLLTTSP